MTYTGLELLMENLKRLIYSNNNPLINNHPLILSEKPQLQLLYQELDSMIQILFMSEHQHPHELEKVIDLKRRFKEAAEEAQDIIDLFVSGVAFRNRGYSPKPDVYKTTLNIEHFMRYIKSIKVEFISLIADNMKMDSSQRTKTQSADGGGTSCTRSPLERKKLQEDIVVGLDHDAMVIVEKLIEDRKQLDIISIVGMGGIGKTTLATKVFNDPFVVHHFYVRAWVTVSQTYEKRDLLIQILESMGVQRDLEKASDSRLREMLHKSLTGKRYLIVIDDIWNTQAWDDLKVFFPHDNTRSRILLTSRLTEVATHSNPHGYIHFLSYLTDKQSWELLQKKVFHGKECPEWLIGCGIKIARRCRGLPLLVVVVAGVLAKESMNEDLWKKVACRITSYLASDQIRPLEILSLSYHNLPCHLKDCFLYLGVFPEDCEFPVRTLIWLWMAEGFIQENEKQSLEDTAEAYLMDLVDRNLLIVAERKFNGDVKAFKVHDLVRNLCLAKSEERFFLNSRGQVRRLFRSQAIDFVSRNWHTPSIRSLIYHRHSPRLHDIAKDFRFFALLRVLDLQASRPNDFPQEMELLVHLRYLAVSLYTFPSSICNLRSLQILIIKTSSGTLFLPCNISDLVNLRHLWSNNDFYLPSIDKPMNLQTISTVVLGDSVENIQKCFPGIKKISSTLYSDEENDFELLPCLEALKLTGFCRKRADQFPKGDINSCGKHQIRFPTTLRKLTLAGCRLPWSDMSIIQSLPNLEVLKLTDNAFDGTLWNTGEGQFQRLRFLKLQRLNIKQWEAYSFNFPCLIQLQLVKCNDLKEIPFEIGDIPTLELIEIFSCSDTIVESAERIKEEQHVAGNYDLHITSHDVNKSMYE